MPHAPTIEILALWLSPGHDFKGRHGRGRLDHGMQPVPAVECHAGLGLKGDRYYGHAENFKGQVTFFDAAVAEALGQELNISVDPAHLRRNILVRGLDLNGLIGRRFRLGGGEFSGSEECRPCYWMDEAVAPGAFEWLKGRGGLRCRIHKSTTLNTGLQSFFDLGEDEALQHHA
ncbi:molybdenum cofactor biosysynthesis protein [Ruficoccus amylovorans]|uniref:Molybdenum cofactor biosysynthesis protein n=1 Tax=Ruficoccus amylovorans TaxID=1804625 RepID=A0A842HIZ1_9BACT|nr:MOSC domain-containing protein [Ruficoccus amylovorans]MBC2595477.1 molybdenum cofactor biosysynthesis protein [Ruficoccus amylovorans]